MDGEEGTFGLCHVCGNVRFGGHLLTWGELEVWVCPDCVMNWADTWKVR